MTAGTITEANILLTMLLLLGFVLFDPYEKTKLYMVTIAISLISVLLPIFMTQQLLPDDIQVDSSNVIANFIAVFIYICLMVLTNGTIRSRKKLKNF